MSHKCSEKIVVSEVTVDAMVSVIVEFDEVTPGGRCASFEEAFPANVKLSLK